MCRSSCSCILVEGALATAAVWAPSSPTHSKFAERKCALEAEVEEKAAAIASLEGAPTTSSCCCCLCCCLCCATRPDTFVFSLSRGCSPIQLFFQPCTPCVLALAVTLQAGSAVWMPIMQS